MAKYRALVDIPPSVKAGDIVEANEELIPEFKSKLEPVSDDEGVEEKTLLTNPNRDFLKAEAAELGLTFASNIPTDKLIAIIDEAKAEKAKADADAGNDDDDNKDDE
jgi:hypothetical protein